jgi:flagellar hook-associated protein 3 FlgL
MARAERALCATTRADADQRALDSSRNAMAMAESALGDAGDLLQRARELVVAAGNPALSATERKDVANELQGLRDQLLQVANRSDGSGGFLFGGQGISAPPFADRPGGVRYDATAGDQRSASDEPLPLTVDGPSAWLNARTGNGVFQTQAVVSRGGAWIDAGRVLAPGQVTGASYQVLFTVSGGATTYSVLRDGAATALTNATYQSGQAIVVDGMSLVISGQPADGDRFDAVPAGPALSIFDTLDAAAAGLHNSAASGANVTQTVQFALRDLDSGMANLNSQRAQVGSWLNRIDNVENRIADKKLAAQVERSHAEDLDMVQAVSDFQSKQTSYDAALRAYSAVQHLSLFQYLNN